MLNLCLTEKTDLGQVLDVVMLEYIYAKYCYNVIAVGVVSLCLFVGQNDEPCKKVLKESMMQFRGD